MEEFSEIIPQIKEFEFWGNFIVTILPTVIIALISYIKKLVVSLDVVIAKLSDWKNRRLIKNVIASRVGYTRYEYNQRFLPKVFWDSVLPIIFVGILFCIFQLIFMLLHIRDRVISQDIGQLIIGIIFIGGVVFAQYARNKDSKRTKWYALVGIESAYIMVSICFLSNNGNGVFLFIKCISYLWTILLIGCINNIVYKNRYVDRFIQISEGIRYSVLLIVFIGSLFSKTEVYRYILNLWLILVLTEYIHTLRRTIKYADVKLHFIANHVLICNKISQCSDSKLLYVMKNGCHRLADVNEINYVSYTIDNVQSRKQKNNQNKICRLGDGTELVYQRYWIDKNQWFYFTYEDKFVQKKYVCHLDNILSYEVKCEEK